MTICVNDVLFAQGPSLTDCEVTTPLFQPLEERVQKRKGRRDEERDKRGG